MKAVKINKLGGPEVLHYEDASRPVPHRGEVLIEVHGSSINPIDTKSIRADSDYKDYLNLPLTPGTDVAGVVVEVGEDVTSLKPGDKVYGQAGALQHGTGAFAEYTVAAENTIAKMPENINFIEAGAMPLAAASAYVAIIDHMKLRAGQKVLIHGGSGGIGSFAIQLAKHLGAYVVTTTSVDGVNYARYQGADEVIDYEFQSFEKTIKDFDAVLDTVGGDVYRKSFEVLKKGGILVSMLCEADEDLMKRYNVRAVLEMTKVDKNLLNKISQLVEEGVLKVNISKTYSLKDTKEAYEAKDNEHVLGKIAIAVNTNGQKR
jgi:2-desacetyl-2-hydroxyethyl bacteriochlorophyllide A dehydrogenase